MAGEKVRAVIAGLGALFDIGGVRKIDIVYVKSGILDDIGDLIHVVPVIVGEIDIEGVEMMVIEIID